MYSRLVITGKWLLIGHRGVGKSTFLQNMKGRFEHCVDLDEEIEKRTKKSILELFEKFDEAAFRQIEATTFNKVLEELNGEASVLIALGAGFKGNIWPRDYKCLWLRKESDVWPRFFKDRPQIGTSDPDNFLSAFIEREERYQSWADCSWTLPEGYARISSEEKTPWPLDIILDEEACLTLVPRLHRDPVAAVSLRKNWGITFELRSDYWSTDVINKVLGAHPEVPFIISVRTKKFSYRDLFLNDERKKNLKIDWDITYGEPNFKPDIYSLHDFTGGLKAGLFDLEKNENVLLKASPILDSFFDLELLWKWREKDPERRMIFPRSKTLDENPRWQWARLLLKGQQKVNFIREASEGLKDQPTVSQYFSHVTGKTFAAVLGNPIMHSYSPYFHQQFFKEKKMPFLAIPMAEVGKATLNFFDSLGAVAFAVTSPLKSHEVFLEWSEVGETSAVHAFNTLVKKEKWYRYNTDNLAMDRSSLPWKIWGSGAVAKQFFKLHENVELYSARTGKLIESKGSVGSNFQLLWAAGDEASPPPEEWKPLKVVDLSYSERSAANLYACKLKLDYENGIEFFKTQALAQQELWKDLK